MTYKYLNLLPISTSTGSLILNEFQAFVNETFEIAPDAYIIQEEPILGSGSYVDVEVRINRAINSYTGEKLGDDFKTIIFKDLGHSSSMGTKYMFDNNVFITVNSEILKNFAASVTVRRCNNTLRWMDSNGNVQSEPVAIEYKISRPRDMQGAQNLVMPAGYIDAYCQMNERTRKLKGNQRFLFGPSENRIAFRIFGDGIRNYLNQTTSDDESGTLMLISMGGNFVNYNTDNIQLGIADYYQDHGIFNSGSNVGIYDIIVDPMKNYIMQSGSVLYNVNYYSGSIIQSGSFVFSVDNGNVPTSNYIFSQETGNSFSIYNLQRYGEATLDILCSGSSGSRILNLELRGDW